MGQQVRIFDGTSWRTARASTRRNALWVPGAARVLHGPVPVIRALPIDSEEAWGLPSIAQGIQALSIPSAEAWGTPTVVPGPVSIAALSIPSAEEWGLARVRNPHDAELTTYATAGTYVYNIPPWCTHIDGVLLGGGGGGREGNGAIPQTGNGGGPGVYVTFTWFRGVDIPWEVTTLVIVVGAGGPAGAKGAGDVTTSSRGGETTISVNGTVMRTATGGNGGSGTNGTVGQSPGNRSYQGIEAIGGATAPSGSGRTVGNPPGGGGGGGAGGIFNGQTAGMAGAAGCAWLQARRVV
ncbi:hypothetical protein SEA_PHRAPPUCCINO_175 [Mycobacterium phage Phrappuccino]|uniref:Glycine-rich domain-containing protein n=1 Tax=Mycobacterium phage Phrappuccino TaxID=2591223 RepID=A0A514DE12_9CAUD|nr:minor tail protein [Mycobacterium phage Phrappuccino]QDH91850.1 hypothetical protein SEA_PHRAPPUCCINO_175 [Mycobacterium phage Phrappuccino]QIQ63291.1 hypothetical protein SEA_SETTECANDELA_175 [Mycobacterium phage Settecandela]